MIKDLAELQKLLKLCRKQGVTEITLGPTVIKFGELPKKGAEAEELEEEAASEGPSPEQMMFYSVQPGGAEP